MVEELAVGFAFETFFKAELGAGYLSDIELLGVFEGSAQRNQKVLYGLAIFITLTDWLIQVCNGDTYECLSILFLTYVYLNQLWNTMSHPSLSPHCNTPVQPRNETRNFVVFPLFRRAQINKRNSFLQTSKRINIILTLKTSIIIKTIIVFFVNCYVWRPMTFLWRRRWFIWNIENNEKYLSPPVNLNTFLTIILFIGTERLRQVPVFYVCTISPLSPPTPLFRSYRSAICNSERSHWMGMPWITNGGPEWARKRTLGEREGRSCKHRIEDLSTWPRSGAVRLTLLLLRRKPSMVPHFSAADCYPKGGIKLGYR